MSHLKIIWTPDPKKGQPEPEPTVVLDRDVVSVNIRQDNEFEEIRSNPMMAAAMAGASPEDWKDLPGDQVAILHHGTDLEVTYTIRARLPGTGIGEFRPALG